MEALEKIKKSLTEFLTLKQIREKTGLSRPTVENKIAYLNGAGQLQTRKYGNATAFKLKGK
jgi:transcriptional antiterminator